jgi:hypothetical protein
MRLPATEEVTVAETSRLWAEFRLAVVGLNQWRGITDRVGHK